MIEVPAATGVITPVDAIVALAVSDDVHVPPKDPFDVNVVEPVGHIVCVPLIVPAFGAAVIVTIRVPVALVHPPEPITV